ncbi:unnamed protein product, partial [Symbiodinium microadriaticum]
MGSWADVLEQDFGITEDAEAVEPIPQRQDQPDQPKRKGRRPGPGTATSILRRAFLSINREHSQQSQQPVRRPVVGLGLGPSVMQHIEAGEMLPRFRHIGSSLQMQLHVSALGLQNQGDARLPAESLARADALVKAFLYSDRHVTNASAGGNALLNDPVEGYVFNRHLCRAAAACVEGGGLLWGHMLSTVDSMVAAGWTPLLFLKKRRYDETPLRVKLHCSDIDPLAPGFEKAVTKILQTQFSLAFLMKSPAGRHQMVHGTVPTYLQGMDRNTAESIMACELDLEDLVPELKRVSRMFSHRVQHAVTDRYAANIKAELAMNAGDDAGDEGGWILSHMFCKSHMIAQVLTKCTALLDSDISGLIALALAMQHAGSVQQLRKALNSIWSERLVVKQGPAPQFPKQHRREVLDMFLSVLPEGAAAGDKRYSKANTKRKQQRMILEHYLNGELRSREICHYTTTGKSRPQILREFEVWVTPALIPGRCEVFPRSRWVGADLATDFAGLLDAHHAIFGDLVARWITSHAAGSKQQPQAAAAAASAEPRQGWAGQSLALADGDAQVQMVSEPSEPVLPIDAIDAGARVADEAAKNEQSWAAFNRSMKDKAKAWAASAPGAGLCMMRIVMQPVFHLLFQNMYMFSSAWEEEQQLRSSRGQERCYRVVEEYRGRHTSVFFDELGALFGARMQALPSEALTLPVRSLMFRILSRTGSCAHRLLGTATKAYPFKLFGEVLAGSPEAVLLDREKACLRDPLSADILSRYDSAQALRSEDALAELSMLALHLEFDISGIESRHAGIRRVVLMRSTQVKSLPLALASAEYACRSFFNNVLRAEPGNRRSKRQNNKARNLTPEQLRFYENLAEVATAESPPHFTWSPGPFGRLDWLPPVADVAKVVLAETSRGSGLEQGLKTSLDATWDARHLLYAHAQREQIKDSDLQDVKRPSKCCTLGICVCAGRGLQADHVAAKLKSHLSARARVKQRRRDKVTKQFKEPPHPKPRLRQLLDAGKLVLCLAKQADETPDFGPPQRITWQVVGHEVASGRLQVTRASQLELDPPQKGLATIWFHVGFINYSNWCFSGLPLFPQSHMECDPPDRLLLHASDNPGDKPSFMTDLELLMKHVEFANEWYLHFYEIIEPCEHLFLEDMTPNKVLVQRLHFPEPTEAVVLVWKGALAEQQDREAAAEAAARRRSGNRSEQASQNPGQAGAGGSGSRSAGSVVAIADWDPAFDEAEAASASDGNVDEEGAREADVSDPYLEAAWDMLEAVQLSEAPAVESEPFRKRARVVGPGPPVPPAPPVAEGQHLDSDRGNAGRRTRGTAPTAAAQVLVLPDDVGELHYYQTNNSVVAFCRKHSGDCRRTRTLNEFHRAGQRQGQGRPLGMLCAWLSYECEDKSSHMMLGTHRLSRELRQEARRRMLEIDGGPDFAQLERPCRPGESEEIYIVMFRKDRYDMCDVEKFARIMEVSGGVESDIMLAISQRQEERGAFDLSHVLLRKDDDEFRKGMAKLLK